MTITHCTCRGQADGKCSFCRRFGNIFPVVTPVPVYPPPLGIKGCVCPPGSELTCRRKDCGRKDCSPMTDNALGPAKTAWRPMSEAPKDGTPLLLSYPTLGVRYGYWDHIGTEDWWIADLKGEDPSGWACPYQENDIDPTHWMFLPPPPEDAP